MLPQLIPLQPAPATLHTTMSSPLPLTRALNCNCAPGLTCAEAGEIETEEAINCVALTRTAKQNDHANAANFDITHLGQTLSCSVQRLSKPGGMVWLCIRLTFGIIAL